MERWQERADRLAAESLANGDPTGWFERLYTAAVDGAVTMPWDRATANPVLLEWARQRRPRGTGRRAVVVGCGLGADAELLADLGFDTTAFDVSATAVRLARERNPDTTVRYLVADLFDPPEGWHHGFDLVIEIYTVQAMPRSVRARATKAVTRLVAPGGDLVVIQAIRDGDGSDDGPPWPLTRQEIDEFGADGLEPAAVTRAEFPADPPERRWRAEFHRVAK